jgi:amino acid adenylation domain-containing protein
VQPDAPGWENARNGFRVVRSADGHASVWPADRPVPGGWSAVGQTRDYAGCLAALDAGEPEPAAPAATGTAPHPTLLDLFDRSVHEHGDRPAVIAGDTSLTYRQLDAAAADVSVRLRRRGITTEDPVAVHLPRGAGVFVAILAVLKAGGSYVPVDTRYPAERRDLMIGRSGARLVITSAELRAGLPPGAAPVTTLGELTAEEPAAPAAAPISGRTAACILFTSGSSGTPKAVVLEHRNLAYFAVNPSLPALRPDDRVGHVSPLSFDAFTFEMWCALAAGAAIVVMPTLPDILGGDVGAQLRRYGITAMLAPTMAVNHIVREDAEAFAALRVLHTGGDVIQPGACERLLAGTFGGSFHNLYGPTEAATACTGHHITAVDGGDVPIGVALAGARIHLLDRDRLPVPEGAVGEVFIGGTGVARGYLGQPGLTAARFLPDPFAGDGSRMYATGDLARRRDGVLEFRGRLDDQVKIRGYRVEPREVERAVARLTGVGEAAVVVAGEGDGKHLIALVTGDGELSAERLRTEAAELLPDYLVPSAIAQVPQIPANGHGKRDLPRLAEMARDALHRGQPQRPLDGIEQYLAGVWSELLGTTGVAADDDFFALGGNSLLAFRLRRRLRTDLKVTVDVQDVLGTTVLGELAALLRARGAGGHEKSAETADA